MLVMGILNVTPDSFADGGLHFDTDLAITHGREMIEDGVDIIDIGGESTRPGADRVSAEEEQATSNSCYSRTCQRECGHQYRHHACINCQARCGSRRNDC